MMRLSAATLVTTTIVLLMAASVTTAFCPNLAAFVRSKAPTSTKTRLFAIGVLARKAKEAEVEKYVEGGVEDGVKEQYKIIREKAEAVDLNEQKVGPLQETLTRRKGTITLIAEYKRKVEGAGFIDEIYDPEILSPTFRNFGAAAIAVMADERMGGCTYADLATFIEEQRRAKDKVPGPIAVINNDLIVDAIQIARSASMGCQGVVLNLSVIGQNKLWDFLKACLAVNIEAIVTVSTKNEAQEAIDLGARIICVTNVQGPDAKVEIIDSLDFPNEQQVCLIANILMRDNKALEEIEEAWICRDKGFNSVWVSDALYKSGADATEHPGAIIKSMTAKSSVKWASPKAKSGKGEGAREYLGDILM